MGSIIGGLFGGNKAAKSATQAANISAQAQREALAYQQAAEQPFREMALGATQKLGALAGLNGLGNQGAALQSLKQSPIYQAVMSSRGAGEEGILRTASATGGLRGGGTVSDIANFNANLQNQALAQSMQNLQGLAAMNPNAGATAQMIANIGATQAQGITAAANAQQQAQGGGLSSLIGLAGSVLPLFFCDSRLKTNVKLIGERNGVNWYSWDWNKEGEQLGLSGKGEGVMAHEIADNHPDAISTKDGYLIVDYSKLGITHNG